MLLFFQVLWSQSTLDSAGEEVFISLVPRVSHICAWPELLRAPRGGFLLPVSPCRVLQDLGGGIPKVSPPIP